MHFFEDPLPQSMLYTPCAINIDSRWFGWYNGQRLSCRVDQNCWPNCPDMFTRSHRFHHNKRITWLASMAKSSEPLRKYNGFPKGRSGENHHDYHDHHHYHQQCQLLRTNHMLLTCDCSRASRCQFLSMVCESETSRWKHFGKLMLHCRGTV